MQELLERESSEAFDLSYLSDGTSSEETQSRGEDTEKPVDNTTSSATHDANSDFVEGLDDIDKFFEGVDPPDELDVGAS